MLLPGLYPCLTMQVNVTAHREQRTAKMVLTVREPNSHERYVAVDVPLGEFFDVTDGVLNEVSKALREMQRLLGMQR